MSIQFNPKSYKTIIKELYADGFGNQKRGRSRGRDTAAKKIQMAPPLSSHIDDSMRKLRTQESHGNLGVRATIFGREERSVSI